MRMIDADALIAQMEADAEQVDEPIAKMFVYAAINDIKHAPTIEKRKTGEWLHDLLQDAIDDGIITEAQAVRIMERVKA